MKIREIKIHAESLAVDHAHNGGLRRFLRAQVTALGATSMDFTATIVLSEILGFWYLHAVGAGAALGAMTAFILSRSWVFGRGEKPVQVQAFRYILVAAGSWILNTGAVFVFTELTSVNYLVIKTLVSITIGISYNYFLAKRFVFR
ncbi:MAG: GtrA family protein [Bacteroidetes bacterium]|nr:MAG: GtrA family protein [Bacteroidota bacterium]